MRKLSIIVPVFNEEKHLAEVLCFLFRSPCSIEREWIVVDDCSTDGSQEILRELQVEHKFELIKLPENKGKGAAIRA